MTLQQSLLASLNGNGERTAIEFGDRKLTYSQLLLASGKVSSFLARSGAGAGTLIGVLLQDRVEVIVAAIGIINAGCVFVPLDGNLPAARVETMLRDLDLRLILSSARFDAIQAEGDDTGTAGYPELSGNEPAYIYFTSGTTGRPKGVVGKSSSLLQFATWEIAEFGIDAHFRVSQLISPYFDAFFRDILVPLLAGGTICIPPDEVGRLTPAALIRWTDRENITLIHCVPSVFRTIDDGSLTADHFQALRYILLSGERIDPAGLINWYAVFGPRITLVNLYGPTETTMIRSFYRIDPADTARTRIPVGRPIAGTEFLIANKGLNRCPMLEPGELYIVTAYSSYGYLNMPELTAERFLQGQEEIPAGCVAFRTGDIARMMPGGSFDLMGRKDRQIKLSGVRIELEEIESELMRSGHCRHAVVMGNAKSPDGNPETLAAFVIPSLNARSVPDLAGELQGYLGSRLPQYMVPSTIVGVPEYPLLPNGKIDLAALLNALSQKAIRLPETPEEQRLLLIWKEILGDKAISTDESFNSAGGNSIGIMRLIGRIYKEFQVRISLGELFNQLTIQKQAAFIIGSLHDSSMAIVRAAKKPFYELSKAQERIYYHYALDSADTAYNLPMVWQLAETVELSRVGAVLQQLVERHESLRTEFRFIEGRVRQVIRESADIVPEVLFTSGKTLDAALSGFIRPFDLGCAPLMRCGVVHTDDGRRLLIVDVHHIVCDGVSQVNLFVDFLCLYNDQPLARLPVQYKDYAEWESAFRDRPGYIACREFWLKAFEGALPTLHLPVLDRGARISHKGDHFFFRVERRLLDVLRQEDGVTTFSVLFAIYLLFLNELTGQDDIVVGINSTGRMQEEVQDVVGLFVKTLPIRYRLDPQQPFKEALRDIHAYLVQAVSRQLYDLADITAALSNNRGVPVGSLFEVMLVFTNFGKTTAFDNETMFRRYELGNLAAKYPITLFANEEEDYMNFRMEYSASFFTREDAEMLAGQFERTLKAATEGMNQPIGALIGSEQRIRPMTDIAFNF